MSNLSHIVVVSTLVQVLPAEDEADQQDASHAGLAKKEAEIIMAVTTAKNNLGFSENFLLSGCAAAVSKTSAAPIERVKLLLQNQGELLKQGRLDTSYRGVGDCITKTLTREGITSFWRGNFASVLRYFPQQALNFAFKVNFLLWSSHCKL